MLRKVADNSDGKPDANVSLFLRFSQISDVYKIIAARDDHGWLTLGRLEESVRLAWHEFVGYCRCRTISVSTSSIRVRL